MIGINKKSQKKYNQLLVVCFMIVILIYVIMNGDMS